MTKRNAKNKTAVVRYNPDMPQYQALVRGAPAPAQKPKKKQAADKPRKTGIPQFLGANLNPFATGSFGVRVPDESTAYTACSSGRKTVTLTTSALGCAVSVFRFPAVGCIVAGTPLGTLNWGFPVAFGGAVDVANITGIRNNFAGIRTAAYGVRLTTSQAQTVAQGFVHIALVPEVFSIPASSWNYPLTVTDMEFSPYYRKIPISELADQEIIISGRYTDATAFRYMNEFVFEAASYPNAFPASGWNAIMVAVTGGGNAVDAVAVEYLAHYEGLPQNTAGVNSVLNTEYSPNAPVTMAASAYVLDNTPPLMKSDQADSIIGQIGHLFNEGVKVVTGVATALLPIARFFI